MALSKELLDRFFDGAFMQRWNDHIRPIELVELDKQSHKAIIAYVLAKEEELAGDNEFDWERLIKGIVFEYIQRTVTTDIKPPVYYWLQARAGGRLKEAVVESANKELASVSDEIRGEFENYIREEESWPKEKKILKAAHWLASDWEFQLIYFLNKGVQGIERTRREIMLQLGSHTDLCSVRKLWNEEEDSLYGFLSICGQLRFQQRWAQTARVPRTSVLGHMFLVAIFAYLVSLQIGYGGNARVNNFFAGLFHDIPEALTRDIAGPVKESILKEAITEYETDIVRKRLLPLIPEGWRSDFEYLLSAESPDGEFLAKYKLDGSPKTTNNREEFWANFCEDRFDPIDGFLIKTCDSLAGYIEAAKSIEYGISTQPLLSGKKSYYDNKGKDIINGYSFSGLFDFYF